MGGPSPPPPPSAPLTNRPDILLSSGRSRPSPPQNFAHLQVAATAFPSSSRKLTFISLVLSTLAALKVNALNTFIRAPPTPSPSAARACRQQAPRVCLGGLPAALRGCAHREGGATHSLTAGSSGRIDRRGERQGGIGGGGISGRQLQEKPPNLRPTHNTQVAAQRSQKWQQHIILYFINYLHTLMPIAAECDSTG